jgi:acyl transferase domain-containing protein/SAM-dependent methyltransferase
MMAEHDQVPGELSPIKRALVEIRDLKAKLADHEARRREPIAIIGTGMRFPGGVHSAESYWDLLATGVDAITEIPDDRWSVDELYDPDPDRSGTMSTRWGGFIDRVDQFDHEFFGISPREAETLDPQQRLLLEVTWEALEHANVPPDSLFGRRAGVFVGIANSDYMRMMLAELNDIDTYTVTGSALSIAAGRLAYVLGIEGPAMSVDTACSSSLVAVHLAARSLRERECDLALAGGVNLILSPELTVSFSRAKMMAPDGRCKAFDAAADGYVRSEGCAVVALKRLSDAVAAGDRVLAVIRGSAINQDGRSGGLTAPNGPSQEAVIRDAIEAAGVDPLDISYVETHGTGTLLGDPIEAGALGAAMCRGRTPDRPLVIGSVKTNIGHTESAAGIAGLIKVVLMMRHGRIPPHLHLRELNPYIASSRSSLVVAADGAEWDPPQGRLAGVSSFGLSGTNAHIILAEPPRSEPPALAEPTERPSIIPVSARSDTALKDLASCNATLLDGGASLAAVAAATQLGRMHHGRRVAVVAAEPATAAAHLRAVATGRGDDAPESGFLADQLLAGGSLGSGVAFVYTGHGSHHPRAGSRLYAVEPSFAAAIDRCAQLLDDRLGVGLHDLLFAEDVPVGIRSDMRYAQPALFCLQYGLASLWTSVGVDPTFVAGHSAGEYAAAVHAGVLSLADGLDLIASRGRLMSTMEAGEMVALFVDEATVAEVVAPLSDDVAIGAVNGPTTTVVSGRRHAVDLVIERLGLGQEQFRRLDVSIAAHSPLVEPIMDDFGEVVGRVRLDRPGITLVSSMTGRAIDREMTDVEYWRRHLREPVRFADVFTTLRAAGCSTFVEIGPHPTLLALGRRCWPDAGATWVPSLHRDDDEIDGFARSVATLYAGGVDIDWSDGRYAAGPDPRARSSVDLPTYPWQRSSHWFTPRSGERAAPATPRWESAVAAAEWQSRHVPIDLDLAGASSQFAALSELAIASMARAMRDLGCFSTPGEQRTADDIAGDPQVDAGYADRIARWLEHLADAGLLERTGDGYRSNAALPSTDIRRVGDGLRDRFTGSEPLLEYVVRCGAQLADVVRGRENPLGTLFPDGSYETVDFLYGGWAVPRYFNDVVRAAAAAVAASRAGRPLRVIEVGAGTGGTSAAVLPALAHTTTAYTFTDISEFFLTRAAERFAEHRFVDYALLDIETSPGDQGFEPGTYDLVIAANVLHATKDLDVTLSHVNALLAPGGVLLAYEGTEHPPWFDTTTALIEGWQLFEDDWREDVPLIGPEVWTRALLAAGFSDVRAFPDDGGPAASLLHHVIVARAAGEEADAAPITRSHIVAPEHSHVVGDASTDEEWTRDVEAREVLAAFAAALPDERHDVMVDVVRGAVAHVLRIGDPRRLRRDQPLLEIGFDSLMAVELRDVLRGRLSLEHKLPATLVFDHPTIAAIATHLLILLDGPADDDVDAQGLLESSRPTSSTHVAPSGPIDELSEAEAEALLLQRLTELEP